MLIYGISVIAYGMVHRKKSNITQNCQFFYENDFETFHQHVCLFIN
jgi:hypothetical protein